MANDTLTKQEREELLALRALKASLGAVKFSVTPKGAVSMDVPGFRPVNHKPDTWKRIAENIAGVTAFIANQK